jgi:hypothetical protein
MNEMDWDTPGPMLSRIPAFLDIARISRQPTGFK